MDIFEDSPELEPQCRVVHHRKEPYDVYIGRPSKWGNPFPLKDESGRDESIRKHREWIVNQKDLMDSLPELKGKVLGCWCKPKACHGDTIAELVNALD